MSQIADALRATEAKAKAAEPTTPSAPVRAARREALRWLDEAFDLVYGCYKDGVSDAKIAEEVGLSAQAIAELRAEFGYDLKTPPEVLEWQKRLQSVENELAAFKDEAGITVAKLLGQIDEIKRQLAKWEAKQ